MVAEERFEIIRDIGDISSEGVCIYNLHDRKFEYVNDNLERVLGVPKNTFMDNPEKLISLFETEELEYLTNRFLELKEIGSVTNIEMKFSQAEGTIKYLIADTFFLRHDQVVVCYVKDSTKSRQNEDYIINFGAKKNALLEMISHNLSAPLNLTKRIVALLEKESRSQRYKAIFSHINFIKISTQQCIDIIHDLLQEEHMMSERILVSNKRFDVVNRISVLIDQYKQSHPGRSIAFNNANDHLYVRGDDVKFMQILNNFISNAIKFTPLNCEIVVTLEEKENDFLVIVKDDGIGIPEHLQPLIFQRYTPAARPGLNGEKSIGVGLSIVKTLVNLMKGEIRVESKTDVGTTVILSLPKEG